MKQLTRAKEILNAEGYTCVMCRGNELYTSNERGVKPLVVWLESVNDFQDCCAADKVVGKATAFLYVLLNVKAVYARVLSKSAWQVFDEYGIAVEYDTLVEYIVNRKRDGMCPFESAVLNVADPTSAYKVIRGKMRDMNITL